MRGLDVVHRDAILSAPKQTTEIDLAEENVHLHVKTQRRMFSLVRPMTANW